jgi:hypothetical protein
MKMKTETLKESQWNQVTASSFADPADVAAYKRCKERGHSDKFCRRLGDNGVGAWGHFTAQEFSPMVALPVDDWRKAKKRGGAKVLIRYNGGEPIEAILADTMPRKDRIKNGAGIDLNPAAMKAFGLKAPILEPGFEWTWS